jgi:hypothetical protein
VAGWWFSLGTLVSSTNKTNCHSLIEILLKVALNSQTFYFKHRDFKVDTEINVLF